jgi:hypothetical protein
MERHSLPRHEKERKKFIFFHHYSYSYPREGWKRREKIWIEGKTIPKKKLSLPRKNHHSRRERLRAKENYTDLKLLWKLVCKWKFGIKEMEWKQEWENPHKGKPFGGKRKVLNKFSHFVGFFHPCRWWKRRPVCCLKREEETFFM